MIKILVVDDEPDVAEFLADMLEDAGWRTSYVYNGVDAVISVIDNHWDLVLMDIRMPKLDGVNALKIIKHIKPQLPIIMFTGQAGQGDMAETTRLGAFTCLMKPVSSQKLLQVVKEAVSSRV